MWVSGSQATAPSLQETIPGVRCSACQLLTHTVKSWARHMAKLYSGKEMVPAVLLVHRDFQKNNHHSKHRWLLSYSSNSLPE